MKTAIPPPNPYDRDSWPAGPWHKEPDRVEFLTAAGYPALIRRTRIGSLCGYVALPSGHPAHGKDIGEVDVSVHGGLTYAGEGDTDYPTGIGYPTGIDDPWWLGFDCAHGHIDYVPGLHVLGDELTTLARQGAGFPVPAYRTIDYVRNEVTGLAAQLAVLAIEAAGGE